MTKVLKGWIILIAIFMITGCVKVEFSMGINKDKSMNFEIIEAVDQSLMEGDESVLDTSGLSKAENQGFLVREYNDGSMKGFKLTKTFENIDTISTEETEYVSDLSLLFEEPNISLFSIKKGFLKNTYTAKLKISSDDMSNQFESSMNDSESDFSFDESELNSSNELINDFDYSQMMSNMEMNFVVTLPYKVVNSNATSVDNNGKQLTWNLLTAQSETIDFEFELYNMTNVYIVAGGILLVIALIVLIIVKNLSKGGTGRNNSIMSKNVDRQNSYINNQTNTDYNNNLSSSNDSSNNIENDNSFIPQSPSVNTINSSNNTSNNMFFNPQNLGMNTIEQTIGTNNFVPNQTSPLDDLSQFSANNSGFNNSYIDSGTNLNNGSDSILSNLQSLNYNETSVNKVPTQPITSNQSTEIQSTMSNLNTPTQAVPLTEIPESDSNNFFQNPNNL